MELTVELFLLVLVYTNFNIIYLAAQQVFKCQLHFHLLLYWKPVLSLSFSWNLHLSPQCEFKTKTKKRVSSPLCSQFCSIPFPNQKTDVRHFSSTKLKKNEFFCLVVFTFSQFCGTAMSKRFKYHKFELRHKFAVGKPVVSNISTILFYFGQVSVSSYYDSFQRDF